MGTPNKPSGTNTAQFTQEEVSIINEIIKDAHVQAKLHGGHILTGEGGQIQFKSEHFTNVGTVIKTDWLPCPLNNDAREQLFPVFTLLIAGDPLNLRHFSNGVSLFASLFIRN